MKKEDIKEEQKETHCDKNCDEKEHKCGCKKHKCESDECHCCEEDCSCDENKEKKCECENSSCENENQNDEEVVTDKYLALAQRVQADFENYRRRMADQLVLERQEGVISVIDAFLPCLDTFKEAKKTIQDEKTLQGVEMIENKIIATLEKLNVERIEAVGQKFDPNLHDVIAVMHDENYDEDIILEEYQAGYKYNGKVIRYSKVIVNKKGV